MKGLGTGGGGGEGEPLNNYMKLRTTAVSSLNKGY